MKASTVVIIILVVIVIVLLFLLYNALKQHRTVSTSTPSPPPSSTPPSTSSSPSSSPTPTINYIVDYDFTSGDSKIDSTEAQQLANLLNPYVNNGIVGFVIWNGEFVSHLTVVYTSQSSFNQLNSQVEDAIGQVCPQRPAISIDYQSLGNCSNVPQVIQSLVEPGYTPSILATGGACQGISV